MKNRAKCKLCNDILESFHTFDYVSCKCGEISISGGMDKLECSAKNWTNFLRVDDNGNEIMVTVKGDPQTEQTPSDQPSEMSQSDMIDMLEAMVKNIENLPSQAMSQPTNHYDLFSFMAIILSILKRQKNN